ncbi:MAG: cytochrome b N-terminal domain-containing protein [Deltaproteobacteria bacterium]|nr:cytochrome b N-terminal domain-containing protein [Deltaproteobacteria bacterium]
MRRAVATWLDERCGWRTLKRVLLDRKIPKGVGWLYTLGSISLFCFLLQVVTGILLAMNYAATPDQAYLSVKYVTEEIPMGAFLRGLHKWGASAMVVFATLHMLRVYFMGAFKYPREMTWIVGLAIWLLILGLGFTGYLLPWDQKGYWATVVGTKIAEQAPFLGEEIATLLRGGAQVGAVTLTRFYAIHLLLLPACLVIGLLVHLFLVIWHGISGPPDRERR